MAKKVTKTVNEPSSYFRTLVNNFEHAVHDLAHIGSLTDIHDKEIVKARYALAKHKLMKYQPAQ